MTTCFGKIRKVVEHYPGKVDALAERLEPRAPDDLHEGAHHQHQPERGNDEDDGRAVAKRAEEQPVYPEDGEGGQRHRNGQEQQRMQTGERGQSEGEVGSQGHRLSVCEVREAQDSEREGHPDRPERIDASQHQTRDQVEVDGIRSRPIGSRIPSRGAGGRIHARATVASIRARTVGRFSPLRIGIPAAPALMWAGPANGRVRVRPRVRLDAAVSAALARAGIVDRHFGVNPNRHCRRGTSRPRRGRRGGRGRCPPSGSCRRPARSPDRRCRAPGERSAPP